MKTTHFNNRYCCVKQEIDEMSIRNIYHFNVKNDMTL